jgi:hypothetical protein
MAATDTATHQDGEEGDLPRRWSVILLAVGIVCGLAAHVFIGHAESFAWQFGPPLAILIGGGAFCLSVDARRWPSATAGSLTLALLLGLLATTAVLRFGPNADWSRDFHGISLVAEALIVAQICVPFLQTWQEQGRWSFPYERLFAHAWNNSLTVALGAAFAGLFWLILWLFALLFGYAGFDQLDRLIEQPAFAWPASAGAGALGIYAGRDYRRIVVALRRIVFTLFSVLTPLYLVLALAFAVALAAGGFGKLAAITSATATLIALLIIGVVLFNAVLRDGTSEAEASRLLRRSAAFLAPALLALCAFAAYGIYLRIEQYGLTPERIWVAAAVAALALHCLAYVAALAARSGWTKMSRQANIGIAGVVALTAALLQTPLADPYRLSAESQYRRLVSGRVDAASFDYGYLKFDLGNAGQTALLQIATNSGVAKREEVEAQLAALKASPGRWNWNEARAEMRARSKASPLKDPQRVTRVPPNLDVPDLTGPYWLTQMIEDCGVPGRRRCLITAIDLTDRPGEELVFAAKYEGWTMTLVLLEQRGKEWTPTTLSYDGNSEQLWSGLMQRDIEAVPSIHRDIKIGDSVIRLWQ